MEVPFHPGAYLVQTLSVAEAQTHREETSPCSEAVVVAVYPLEHRQVYRSQASNGTQAVEAPLLVHPRIDPGTVPGSLEPHQTHPSVPGAVVH